MKNYQLALLGKDTSPDLRFRWANLHRHDPLDSARSFIVRGCFFALIGLGLIVFGFKKPQLFETWNPASVSLIVAIITMIVMTISSITKRSPFGTAISRLCRILNCTHKQLATMSISEINDAVAMAADGQGITFVSKRIKGSSASPAVIMSRLSIETIVGVCVDLGLDLDKTHIRTCIKRPMDMHGLDVELRAQILSELPALVAA